MICKNCGGHIIDTYNYCPYCGDNVKPFKYKKHIKYALLVLLFVLSCNWWYYKDTYYFEPVEGEYKETWQEFRINRAKQNLLNNRDSLYAAPSIIEGISLDMTLSDICSNTNYLIERDSVHQSFHLTAPRMCCSFSDDTHATANLCFIKEKLGLIEIDFTLNCVLNGIDDDKKTNDIASDVLRKLKKYYGRKYIEFNKDQVIKRGLPFFTKEERMDRIYLWYYFNQQIVLEISYSNINLKILDVKYCDINYPSI